MGTIIDITGDKYGRLTVLLCVGKCGSRIKWHCRCDCGNEVIVTGNALRTGNTTSCGCFKKERTSEATRKDISGKRFGRLLVLARCEKSYNSYYWMCKCDCGVILKVNGCNLVTGGSASCGCLRKEKSTKHGLCKKGWAIYRNYLWNQDPSRKIRHNISNSVRKAIGNKGGNSFFDYVPYTVHELKEHLESLWEPWMNWDNYGGKMNDPRKTWHIDHIVPHSKFPYKSMEEQQFRDCWALVNLQPLEKIANRLKWNYIDL